VAIAKPTAKPSSKPEDDWREARLIPTTGIGGQEEQEGRATSSLLAVVRAVPEFGRALLAHVDAPAGRIRSFTEVRLDAEDDKKLRPDGAIVVERGRTRWRCLVEVKTGGVPLRADQIGGYLELARKHGFDAVLSISNQITSSPTESPLPIDKRWPKRIPLRHLSWWHVMTEARLQREHRGISDPDQAWILGELIAYLDNEKAGAGGFEDMGDKWVQVRDGARQRTLRTTDAAVRDVASRWEQFIQFLALGLQQDLGRNVVPVWPPRLDVAGRLEATAHTLADDGRVAAAIRVPNAIAPVAIEADLRTRQLTTSVEVPAPGDGRAKTRITWLLRQVKDAPDSVRVEVRYPNAKEPMSAILKDVREKPERLLFAADQKRDPRSFRLSLSKDLGMKRGRGAGSFISDTRQQTLDFYRIVVQPLRAWNATAPKLPAATQPVPLVASPEPPSFSGDGRDPGSGADPEEMVR
jgi:hypothetical protein